MTMKQRKRVIKSQTPEQILALKRGAAYRKWRGLLTNAQQLQKDLEDIGISKGPGNSYIQFCLSQILTYLEGKRTDQLIRGTLNLRTRDTEDKLNVES